MQKPILEGLLGKMGPHLQTRDYTPHTSVCQHLFSSRFSSLMLISSQLPDAGTILNARWTWACCDCSTLAVISSFSPSSSILFLKVRQCPQSIRPLLLALRPPRWKRRGLRMKLSSAQWNSCSSELRVGCLIPSLCSLHSTDDAEDEPWEERKSPSLCQDTSSARCQRWETQQLLVEA